MLSLPFHNLNIRWNPFGELGEETRTELAVADLEALVPLVRTPGTVLQFLGNSGCGKTTSLLVLHRFFKAAPFVRIRPETPASIPPGHPLFLDELQLLPRWQRWRVFTRGASFVVSTHEDYARELTRRGLVVHTFHPAQQVDASRLAVMFRNRIEWARRGPGRVPGITGATIEQLLTKFGKDVRSMEHHLYEVFQNLEEIRDV